MTGFVWLVGAGPGDPDLLTVKGRRCLEGCDVVVYDALANPSLLDLVPASAERVYAGKRSGRHSLPQPEIDALLVGLAAQGKRVVRLKGGDPFVFGRGGEEVLALQAAGIPFEVVPGVSAGAAVPAYAGIPVTHRGVSGSVTFVAGHSAAGASGEDWAALAACPGTLVVFMGLSSLAAIAGHLVAAGRAPTTPTAVISNGTTPSQRTVVSTLRDVAADVAAAGLQSPALLVVGDVVSLRERCAWFPELAGALDRVAAE